MLCPSKIREIFGTIKETKGKNRDFSYGDISPKVIYRLSPNKSIFPSFHYGIETWTFLWSCFSYNPRKTFTINGKLPHTLIVFPSLTVNRKGTFKTSKCLGLSGVEHGRSTRWIRREKFLDRQSCLFPFPT